MKKLFLGFCLGYVMVANSLMAATEAASKPNIIFILTDDMGWGDLGIFYQNGRDFAVNRNQPAFATPNLDTLARQGVQLRRHYTAAPVCAPARSSLLCGVTQGHSGVRDNQFDWPLENNHTLATVLKQAGYATAIIGKYGLDGNALGARSAGPLLRGFDYFFGYLDHMAGHYHYPKEDNEHGSKKKFGLYDGTNDIIEQLDKCYTADLWTARAKKYIVDQQAANPAQPFFLFLAFDTPHAKLEVPACAYPAGGGIRGGVQWIGKPHAMINTAIGTVDTWIHPDYTNATWDADNNPATAEVAWPLAEKRHATMMRRLDDCVGDLMQTLKDLGCDSNTIVIFTSDNGPHNESAGGTYTQNPTFFNSFGPMDGIKRDSWEGGMREPALARWPGHFPAGTTNLTASQFQDWMPTLAEFAGLPAPARSDGVSLVPTLTGTGTQRQGAIYVEYNFKGKTPGYTEFDPSHRNAIRNQEQVVYVDGYKGIRYDITSNTNDFIICDSLHDARETTNLAGTSAYFISLQQRMKNAVLHMRRPDSTAPRPYDGDLIPGVSTNTVTGLTWQAFEGGFPWVPDFTLLSNVATGQSTNGIDLSVRTRNDNIGVLYTGYINVPADGTYTFYLNTDGRAFLRIHQASVLDADFGYVGGSEVSATINLQAGRHPVRLGYVRGAGGVPSLTLQWASRTIVRQVVPASAFGR